jgi:hypothetical protein
LAPTSVNVPPPSLRQIAATSPALVVVPEMNTSSLPSLL